MSELKGYGICKECTVGTLNNELHTCFELDGDVAVCTSCGGSHIDGELYTNDSPLPAEDSPSVNEKVEMDAEEYGDPYSDEPYEREVGA